VAAVIREVAAGRRYVDPEVVADALSDERSPLTDRELEETVVGGLFGSGVFALAVTRATELVKAQGSRQRRSPSLRRARRLACRGR
jgi:hypothetical protein